MGRRPRIFPRQICRFVLLLVTQFAHDCGRRAWINAGRAENTGAEFAPDDAFWTEVCRASPCSVGLRTRPSSSAEVLATSLAQTLRWKAYVVETEPAVQFAVPNCTSVSVQLNSNAPGQGLSWECIQANIAQLVSFVEAPFAVHLACTACAGGPRTTRVAYAGRTRSDVKQRVKRDGAFHMARILHVPLNNGIYGLCLWVLGIHCRRSDSKEKGGCNPYCT